MFGKVYGIDALDHVKPAQCQAGFIRLDMPDGMAQHRRAVRRRCRPAEFGEFRLRFLQIIFADIRDACLHRRRHHRGRMCFGDRDETHRARRTPGALRGRGDIFAHPRQALPDRRDELFLRMRLAMLFSQMVCVLIRWFAPFSCSGRRPNAQPGIWYIPCLTRNYQYFRDFFDDYWRKLAIYRIIVADPFLWSVAMATVTTLTRHGFLAPGHNGWAFWNHEGNVNIVHPGVTHRALESLAYAIDKLTQEGWKVRNIFVEGGNPTMVFLSREETMGS